MSHTPTLLARLAMQYLETIVVPMVMSAARLSPDTGVEEFVELNLTTYTSIDFGACSSRHLASCDLAGLEECEERPILGISIIAMQLANNSRAKKICKNLIELMMQDAVEFHAAGDLFSSTCLVGVDNSEYKLRYLEAEKNWEKWKETDQEIMLTQEEFWLDINDLRYFISQHFRANE